MRPMTHATILKAPISHSFYRTLYIGLSTLLLAGAVSGCKAPINKAATPAVGAVENTLPPFRKALSCLPENAAIIAAHRGTDKTWRDQAENSVGALNALIKHGTLIAEIDVAGLKDGTLITFHDGVWDKISTAKGPISTSRKADLESILLRSRAGGLTADRPPQFKDMLRAAKGQMYLEIDFKSSANKSSVIKAIRDADMADHVMLIAYNSRQAAELERLAPEMFRSNPPEAAKRGHAVWMGYEVANGGQAKSLRSKGNYTIGRIGDPNRQPPLSALRKASDILVTDYADRHDGIIGLTKKTRAAYEVCLVSK